MSMNPGGKLDAADMVEKAKAVVEQAAAEEQQLSLLDPVTPWEAAEAQERLGVGAPPLAVLREARRLRGRPKGVKNRRTDDFRRYILQFGQDPAITLMQIASTEPEVLVERSYAMDPDKKKMSYSEAVSHIQRAAEALMPFIHSKQAAVDKDGEAVVPLIVVGHGHTAAEAKGMLPGSLLDGDWDEVEGDGE